jgi:hypothetical protein
LRSGAARLVTAFAPSLNASAGGDQGPGVPAAGLLIELTAPVTAGTVVLALGIALLGGLVAGVVGRWRAARLRPAAGLTHVT